MANISTQVTFVSEFLRHVEATPDTIAIRYLHDGDVNGPSTSWSYAELHRRAQTIAVGLVRANVRPGDRALLLYTECLGFCEAFLGCLLAGVIPVPVAAPEAGKLDRALARLHKIARVSGAHVLLTAPSLAPGIADLFATGGERAPLAILPTWGDAESVSGERLPTRKPDDIAFLQFTSGSTSDPKGVIVTHANLAANQRLLAEAMSVGSSSNLVSWLPVHHDMGLIAGLLMALWVGRSITTMLPQHFIERPSRWLEAISGQQGVLSGAPNFAFALVTRKLSDDVAARLDLSGWQTAYCGSEPVRYEVLRKFAERLEPHGFRPHALMPCYGLAEVTVYASVVRPWTGRLGDEDNAAMLDGFVISGRQGPELEWAIVDPVQRTRCADEVEGEVWLRGPNVARGYWADAEQTARTFGAQITGETEPGTWLRTGDLGRMRDGALFITGRMKDLIIVNGRNIYPQDVELAIDGCHPSVRVGCATAFAVAGEGSETVGVAFELREREAANDAIVKAACAAVASALDVQLTLVALLPPRTILKTTSGKPQRRATRAALEDGSLTPLLLWRATHEHSGTDRGNADILTELAAWISAHTGRVLPHDVDQAGLDELGIDSIARAELLDWIHANFGRRLTIEQLLGQPTLAGIATLIGRDAGLVPRTSPASPMPLAAAESPVLPALSWLQTK